MSQIIQAVKYNTTLKIYSVNLNEILLNNESNSDCNF